MPIPPKAPPAPEIVALVRQRYLDNVPVSAIRVEFDLTKHQVYFCLDGGPRGPGRLPAIARRRIVSLRKAAMEGDKSLVERLWRAARRKVDEVEDRLARAGHPPDEVERDARSLAVLVRTLRELAALDEVREKGCTRRKQALLQSNSENDDSGPADIEEFRRELARKMDAIIAGRAARTAGEPDAGQD